MSFEDYFGSEQFKLTDGETLMNTNYQPIEFIVDGLIPKIGLVTLNANPKTGKSLFTEQLAQQVSDGESNEFLGRSINIHGEVLLLALEDTESRISTRFKIQNVANPTSELHVATRWTSANKGIEDIDRYLTQHSVVLIIIDTLQRFRSSQISSDYAADYYFMSRLKKICDSKEICIILVHHLRKSQVEGEDEICRISGSMGISGAADVNILMERQRRSYMAELSVSGRDVPDFIVKIRLDPQRLTWHAVDEVDTIPEERLTPERIKFINALKELGGVGTPKEIAKIINGNNKNVSNQLATMVKLGLIGKSAETSGAYVLLHHSEVENE